jgi:hypothetical protein
LFDSNNNPHGNNVYFCNHRHSVNGQTPDR